MASELRETAIPLQLVRLHLLEYSVSGCPAQNRCREMGEGPAECSKDGHVLEHIDLWMEMEGLGFVQLE